LSFKEFGKAEKLQKSVEKLEKIKAAQEHERKEKERKANEVMRKYVSEQEKQLKRLAAYEDRIKRQHAEIEQKEKKRSDRVLNLQRKLDEKSCRLLERIEKKTYSSKSQERNEPDFYSGFVTQDERKGRNRNY